MNQQHFYDALANTEAQLQADELTQTGKSMGRSIEPKGVIEGSYD